MFRQKLGTIGRVGVYIICILQGLKVHLEACHDRFVYGFCEDHPDVPRTIHVACAEASQILQEETAHGVARSSIVQVSAGWRRSMAAYS